MRKQKTQLVRDPREFFIYFTLCIEWLTNSWRWLNLIHQEDKNPLRVLAFRFALIEYCKSYKNSEGTTGRLKLCHNFIPIEFISLHERIIKSRDKVHAHSDLNVMDANLKLHEFKGQRYTTIALNIINGGEEIQNIQDIISLIEGTLDKMYVRQKVLESALPS